MNLITLTSENLSSEHICCALDSKTSNIGVAAKKEWLSKRLEEGLRFKKLDARGKVFIEYIPVEMGWMPIQADNYMLINCHWVSGSYKGKGYGSELLAECEKEAFSLKKKGVVVVTSSKKKPFLSDKSFYIKHGYKVVDKAPPYFELLAKQFGKEDTSPQFADSVNNDLSNQLHGIDIFYTAQCPFTIPYIEMLKPVILESLIPIRVHHIKSRKEAQNHICPITTYSVFVNGKFYTQEILTPKKLQSLASKV